MKSYLTGFNNHPSRSQIDDGLFESMYELFVQIGVFWENTPTSSNLRADLFTFMSNRIEIDTNYIEEYENAAFVLREIIKEHQGNVNEAYAAFFTDPAGLESPPQTKIARARQKVSNEFIAFQLTVGGFESFGAKNYPGYIAGSYVPGNNAPYRTKAN